MREYLISIDIVKIILNLLIKRLKKMVELFFFVYLLNPYKVAVGVTL